MAQLKSDQNSGRGVYEQIIHDIRLGRLLPGERLTETDLAARFQISRTPVREAIRQLETDGGYPALADLKSRREILAIGAGINRETESAHLADWLVLHK